jgi:TatA/E family protein of Tat protein translocase
MIGDILQPTHLLFILVVALVVLGPKRLPEVARTLGNGLRDFRAAINGETPHDDDDRYEIPDAHTREDLSHEDVGRVYEPGPTTEPEQPAQPPAPQSASGPGPASPPTPDAHAPQPPPQAEPATIGDAQPAPAPEAPHEPAPTSQHEANGAESVPDRPQHADKPA